VCVNVQDKAQRTKAKKKKRFLLGTFVSRTNLLCFKTLTFQRPKSFSMFTNVSRAALGVPRSFLLSARVSCGLDVVHGWRASAGKEFRVPVAFRVV
jgi:hypothetical protein